MSKSFYTYVDVTADEFKPFYVGKGNERRVDDPARNEVHTRISNKHGLIRLVVFETLTEHEAFDLEVLLIEELKTFTHGGEGWWGANLTRGGDGTSGRKLTSEQRDKLSIALTDRKMPDDFGSSVSAAQKKVWQSPEYRAKMSAARRGKSKSGVTKQLIREKAKQRWSNPENRERYIESNRARWNEERIEHHSTVAKQRWSNPEEREHASEAAKKRWASEEAKLAQSEAVQRLWADPVYRSKLSKPRICKRCQQPGHMTKTCKS